jgi:glutamate dehydrogenase/leucine dehydrogenase
MNTGAREMAWFFDEYSKYKGFSPGVVTGKVSQLTRDKVEIEQEARSQQCFIVGGWRLMSSLCIWLTAGSCRQDIRCIGAAG